MIKSLLQDEDDQEDEKSEEGGLFKRSRQTSGVLGLDLSEEETSQETKPEEAGESVEEIRSAIEHRLEEILSDEPIPDKPVVVPEEEREPDAVSDDDAGHEARTLELEARLKEIEEELRRERESAEGGSGEETEVIPAETDASESAQTGGSSGDAEPGSAVIGMDAAETPASDPFASESQFKLPYEPESTVESFRNSGLAWSAAIALFGSVVFMLILGWFADLLLGFSPWGKVAGIVVGAIIGFLQFFRITSQILRPRPTDFERVSLRPDTGPGPADEDAGPGRTDD